MHYSGCSAHRIKAQITVCAYLSLRVHDAPSSPVNWSAQDHKVKRSWAKSGWRNVYIIRPARGAAANDWYWYWHWHWHRHRHRHRYRHQTMLLTDALLPSQSLLLCLIRGPEVICLSYLVGLVGLADFVYLFIQWIDVLCGSYGYLSFGVRFECCGCNIPRFKGCKFTHTQTHTNACYHCVIFK